MAERFYFDLTNGAITISDETGVMALDLNDALLQAKEVMDKMQDNDEHEVDAHKWMIVVRDAAGKAVTRITVLPHDPDTPKAS